LNTDSPTVIYWHSAVEKIPEFLDSVTGDRIAAGADEYPGGKMSGFSRWNDSQEAFESRAGRLKKFLDNPQGL